MKTKRRTTICLMVTATIFMPSTHGVAFEIPSYTIDSGGGFSAGGDFDLEGTIGQPDAGFMSGGEFDLEGGFWASAVPSCACHGDMNGDGVRNGNDIQLFTACLIDGGSCVCADVDGSNGVDVDDIAGFVADLLGGINCD